MNGFVTQDDAGIAAADGDDHVAVYLQMSYQIGGFLIVVDERDVRPIEMEMEEALRIALAAGLSIGIPFSSLMTSPSSRPYSNTRCPPVWDRTLLPAFFGKLSWPAPPSA